MSDSLYTSKQGALFIQVDGPNTRPYYVGCHDVDDINEPKGDIELIQCFDELGRYKTVGATSNPPETVTTTLTTYLGKTRDWLEKITCPATLFLHQRCNGRADLFSNYERTTVLRLQKVTSHGRSNLVRRDEDNRAEHSFDIAALPPVYDLFKFDTYRQTIAATSNLNDVAFCNDQACQGPCAEAEGICQVGYAVGRADIGSPAAPAALFKTDDGGLTWSAAAADPFAVGEDIASVVCFPISATAHRVLVARGTQVAAEPAKVAYSDDGGASWTVVTVGSKNNQAAVLGKSLFDQHNIWLVTTDGYIYKSEDAGLSWVTQEAGTITPTAFRAVHFNEKVGMVVGAADFVLVTTNGGATWAAASSTGSGDTLNTVRVLDRKRAWVGTSGGEIYYTVDGGATWNKRSFPGDGSGAVTDIQFVNDLIGAMLHDKTILTTIDGGYSWEALTMPTGGGLNALYMCSEHLMYAVGNVDVTTATVVKALAGEL